MMSHPHTKPYPQSPPTTTTDDLRKLSGMISKGVDAYLERLRVIGAPAPNLQDPFPDPIMDEAAQVAKLELVRVCERVMALVQGPMQWLVFQNMAFIDPACVGVVVDLGIPEFIAPGPEPTSLDQLVEATGASKDVLRKFFFFFFFFFGVGGVYFSIYVYMYICI